MMYGINEFRSVRYEVYSAIFKNFGIAMADVTHTYPYPQFDMDMTMQTIFEPSGIDL